MSSFKMGVIPEQHQATVENMISEAIRLLEDNQTHLVLGLATTFISMLAEVTGEKEEKLMVAVFEALKHTKLSNEYGGTLS